MWRKTLTHWIGLIVIGALLSASDTAVNRASASPQDILYSQLLNPGGNSVRSTNGNIDAQDAQIGDDFTLNCPNACIIQSIFAYGNYQQGAPMADSVLVQIYSDSETGVLGDLIDQRTVFPPNFVDNDGEYTVNMNPPLMLGGGIWWVSLQANINSVAQTWTWDDRSYITTTTNSSVYPSIFKASVGGQYSQCLSWRPRVAVCGAPSFTAAPDMLFEINGVYTTTNVTPYILRLLPPYVSPGSGDITPLIIRGNSFVSGSVVNWDGTPQTTTFISNSELQITVPASALAVRDLVAVTVFNPAPGGGTSNTRYFLVGEPVFLPIIRR